MLLSMLILLVSCSGCGGGENLLQNEFEDIDEEEVETMKSESLGKRELIPAIDQKVPALLESATLALG